MNNRQFTIQQVTKLTEELSKLNQEFYFDWSDHKTFKPNANRVATVEALLEEANQLKDLPKELQEQVGSLRYEVAMEQLGPLNYKLATYYNHIQRNPDKALIHLNAAKSLLSDHKFAWVFNHIAYSYQQKMAMTEDAKQRHEIFKLARDNYNFIIDHYVYATPAQKEEMQVFAFAMCVKAQSEYAANDIKSAQLSYRHALECYEAMNAKDDQYARTLRRYAVITAQLGLDLAAKDHFEELDKHWKSNMDINNPYMGQFYETYADFIVENDPKQASTALQYYRWADAMAVKNSEFERGEHLQQKMDDLKKQMNASAEKQLPKISLYKHTPSQLSVDEPVFQKEKQNRM